MLIYSEKYEEFQKELDEEKLSDSLKMGKSFSSPLRRQQSAHCLDHLNHDDAFLTSSRNRLIHFADKDALKKQAAKPKLRIYAGNNTVVTEQPPYFTSVLPADNHSNIFQLNLQIPDMSQPFFDPTAAAALNINILPLPTPPPLFLNFNPEKTDSVTQALVLRNNIEILEPQSISTKPEKICSSSEIRIDEAGAHEVKSIIKCQDEKVIDTVKEERPTITKPEQRIAKPKSIYKLKSKKQSKTIIKKKMEIKPKKIAIIKPKKAVAKLIQNLTIPSSFECPECHRQFTKSQSLGGHLSKSHPGASKKYQQKVERRDERKDDRYILQLSKQVTRIIYPDIDLQAKRNKLNVVRSHIKSLDMTADPSISPEAVSEKVKKLLTKIPKH